MPITPRSGAQLVPISLVTPGFNGLNKQNEATILGVTWATEANNCAFDGSGRLCARNGWATQTSSPISGTPTITGIFEQIKLDGTTQIILSASNHKLYLGVSTPTDITGTATVTADDWQFVNYNGKVYGVQQGMTPIVYDGSTSFANLTAATGTLPTGNCALAFSGRLWISDSNKQSIKYSALLDATKWATADGAGSFDFTSVWPNGSDEIVALATFNKALVVFGKNSIILLTDGNASAKGIDPNTMYVYDMVNSVGCIARDSVSEVEGTDLLFLSKVGVQSLQKLVITKSNPLFNISGNNRDYMVSIITNETSIRIKGKYSPYNSMYVLSCPGSGLAFYFNTKNKLDDGTYPMTTWDTMIPYAMCAAQNGTFYISLAAVGGQVGAYTGYLDNGAVINMSYASGWIDLGQDVAQYLKILKTLTATVFTTAAINISLKWDIDFSGNFKSVSVATGDSTSSEWGIMEWGTDEWSGGLALTKVGISTTGTGQYFRVGISAAINNSQFAMQQMNMFTKIGRLAK